MFWEVDKFGPIALFIAAGCWWGILEYVRGRPSVSGNMSVCLMFIGPIGAIALMLLAGLSAWQSMSS